MRIVRLAATTGLVLLIAVPVPAQDDGGGMIQRFLQDKLSTAGREVRISGFEGLLAGEARLAELTIADDEGVWLTLRDAVLDWNRAAMLRGRLSVEELSAGELIVLRIPAGSDTPETPEAPKAEATGFSLPELPVAIRIDRLAIERAEIGEAVIGQAAVIGLDGAVALADGEGMVDITAQRLDGRDDSLALRGGFVNETRVLSVDLALEEAAGGLVSTALNLPGTPSVDLKVAGEGPLTDFNAEIALRTDDEDRIAGDVRLQGDGEGGSEFAAEIGGDITPILPEDFHDFFGDDVRLLTNGSRSPDGAFDLDRLSLTARSLDLQGEARIGADGLPSYFNLTAELSDGDGDPVRLPAAGEVLLGRAAIDAHFDAAEGSDYEITAVLQDLDTATADVGLVGLTGFGTIETSGTATVTADVSFQVNGLEMAEAGLAEAIGSDLSGSLGASWEQGTPLQLTSISASGADYGLTAVGDVRIVDRNLKLSGDGTVQARDLSRFSTLAGRPLTGNATARVSGQGDALGGAFAATLDLEADGLSIGQETADRLLTEPVTLATAIRRDTEGTTLDRFQLRSRAISADASGKVGGGDSDIGFEAALDDVGLVLPGREGALTLTGDAREDRPGDWQVALDLAGPYGLEGNVGGRVHSGESDLELALGLPDVAPLVPGHTGAIRVEGSAAEAEAGTWAVDLDVAAPYELTSEVEGIVAPGATDVGLTLSLPDIAPLVPGHSGAVELSGNAAETESGGWTFDLNGSGPYAAALDLDGSMGGGPGQVTLSAGLPDIAPLVPGLSGPVSAEGTATDAGDGLWQVDFDTSGPIDAVARIDGTVGGGQSDLDLDVAVPDLSPLVPQLAGPLRASGNAAEAGDGRWNVDFDVAGPYGATAAVDGAVGASGTDVALDVKVPDISPLAPGYTGAIDAQASAAQAEDGSWALDVAADGPYGSTLAAGGTYGNAASDLSYEASLPDIGAVVPDLSGPVTIAGTAAEVGDGAWNIALDAGGPYNGTAQIAGTAGPGVTAVDLTLAIPSVAPFAPGVTGGLQATGRVAQAGDDYSIDLNTQGPEGVSSTVSGTVAGDFSTVSIDANGAAPLGLANRALAPNSLSGTAQFDLAVNGPPALQSVSGNVTVNGGVLALPTYQQSLENIGVNVGLNGDNVQLDVTANGQSGGSVGANGTLQLSTLTANLETRLNNFVLTDPLLFKTSLNGGVAVNGPLTGGANITGRIDVGRTEIRVPDGGLGFGGSIPNMRHINEPAAVRLTRERAGLVEEEQKAAAAASGTSGGSGADFGLNVVVSAPSQIFIRGRGLDTEMGGAVQVTGTTSNPNPVGEIEVIRGRLDILGQRLDMEDGTVSLAGGLQPYMDLTATSSRDDFEFLAQITGPIDSPEFELVSVPELPKDEVLAHFLFGKGLDDLSPLQAVQLASAVATLSGRSSGPGVLGGFREGLGLDDLDLATTSEGDTEVRAGKYISDNVYTEFVADSDGETEIDINIDLTKNFTIKGTTDSKGESSIGIYFERDY